MILPFCNFTNCRNSLWMKGIYWLVYMYEWASLVAQMVKIPSAVQETRVWSLGGEDPSGEGNGYPFQYSCLKNPMDREAWLATVYAVAENQTLTEWLSMHAWCVYLVLCVCLAHTYINYLIVMGLHLVFLHVEVSWRFFYQYLKACLYATHNSIL